MMDDLYLIATVAGQSVAIRASTVESVVEVGAVTTVPLAPPHVAGMTALRSRVLTVISCEVSLGLPQTVRVGGRAVVVGVDGHNYALLVGSIEDVRVIDQPPQPIRGRLEAGWARVAIGMIENEGEAVLLIDPDRIVAGPDEAMAA